MKKVLIKKQERMHVVMEANMLTEFSNRLLD
jgi:hypothetical protein